MKNDRRGFFKKIFGGLATVAIAPKVAAIKLPLYEKKFLENSLPYKDFNYALSGTACVTGLHKW